MSEQISRAEPLRIDFEKLLKLRIVVGRFGEIDGGRWWNSSGQLGPVGAAALRRGFPRTYHFAQARSVFAIAGHRCDEQLGRQAYVTLWRLLETIEEEFDARWEGWLDQAADWGPFFDRAAGIAGGDLIEHLTSLQLVSEADLTAYWRLGAPQEGRSVVFPEAFQGTDAEIALLALGFARGEPGTLVVPCARMADA
jgi:hypothetical protein